MLKYYYTLNELLDKAKQFPLDPTITTTIHFNLNQDMLRIMTLLLNLSAKEQENASSLIITTYMVNANMVISNFCMLGTGGTSIQHTPESRLMSLIKLRFGDHYIEAGEELPDEIRFVHSGQSGQSSGITPQLKEFADRFIGVILASYPKYINILNIYENNLAKLMNPVKTTREGYHASHRAEDYDNDVIGKNIFNDTPQTTDVVATMEGDQYVTELSKSTAHTDNVGSTDENGSNTETTNDDRDTTMRRIAEIQDSFQKVLYNWSEEFKGLFIEPLNV